jgi:hypothetical protein
MLKATDPRRRQRHAAVIDLPLELPPALPDEPHVSASRLSNGEKNQLWRYLKAHRPDRVLFFEEPVVRQLLGQGAEPTFPLSELHAAGLEIERARWS